jgi:dipeptidyl aminopeptidase/acylaminoacyl peptidase
VLLGAACTAGAASACAQEVNAEREKMYAGYLHLSSLVHGGVVRAHWMEDGDTFWYAEGAPEEIVIYKVDANGVKTPLFDTPRLRAALEPFAGKEFPPRGLPFDDFTFAKGERHIHFAVGGHRFDLDLDHYTASELSAVEPAAPQTFKNYIGQELPELPSLDHKWLMTVKDGNVWLRSAADGQMVQITRGSDTSKAWDGFHAAWSPDSARLAITQVNSSGVKRVPLVPWLSRDQDALSWSVFPRAGETLFRTELDVLDIGSKQVVKVNSGEMGDRYIVILGWRPDSSELLFFRGERECKRLDLMAADPTSGKTRIILTETADTFVEGMPYDDRWVGNYAALKANDRFIWRSQKDGWTHLYLCDLGGKWIRQLTKGPFSVVRTVHIDDANAWVYFLSHEEKRPYDTQLYRVDFTGQRLEKLTDEDGQHFIQFAPSGRYFLDTNASIERAPATELRTPEGKLRTVVSRADTAFLKDLHWKAPESFIVKAADGKTDLYGVLYKPWDFDSNKKYPVIEYIYAGPFTTAVPREFASDEADQLVALAQLGFIVFVVDGRGTSDRSKAFQDVMYGNIGRYEIPDHVAALKEVAAQRGYMDMSRVGIFGLSWGGYFATRGMLLAPDVYRVGVASSPATDLRGLAMVTIEPYMGVPEHNSAGYDYGSNVALANRLQGKLLLVHGTSDANAPFSHTMQLVNALVQANKTFDLLVFPEQPHVYTGHANEYWLDAIRRYFVTNLLPARGAN